MIKKGYVAIRAPKVRGNLGCWTWSLEKFNNESDRIVVVGSRKSFSVKKRTFVDKKEIYKRDGKLFFNVSTHSNSRSIIDYSTNDGTIEFNNIMGSHGLFDNPKNIQMIEYLLSLNAKKSSIILDSFAGSGTTAHAVLNMNKQDGGNRKFILVEMMDYAESITAERVKRVIDGYGAGDKTVEGAGGGFSYYELGIPLFKEDKTLNEDVGEAEIRKYVYYMETKKPLEIVNTDTHYYLGKNNDTVYYFYYEKETATTLNFDFLSTVKTKAAGYVIYADKCALSKEQLAEYGITFKKIPRDITRL